METFSGSSSLTDHHSSIGLEKWSLDKWSRMELGFNLTIVRNCVKIDLRELHREVESLSLSDWYEPDAWTNSQMVCLLTKQATGKKHGNICDFPGKVLANRFTCWCYRAKGIILLYRSSISDRQKALWSCSKNNIPGIFFLFNLNYL